MVLAANEPTGTIEQMWNMGFNTLKQLSSRGSQFAAKPEKGKAVSCELPTANLLNLCVLILFSHSHYNLPAER